jgi:solute:Na+ symporter, SSS family
MIPGIGFSTWDFIVLILYFAGVVVFGLLVSGRQRNSEDYFLGGHRIPWWAVMFSIVATETSTLTFISIPAVAYTGDLTFLQIAFGYLIGRIAVAVWFLPRYFEGRLATAYQFIGMRFGPGARLATSSTFMLTRILADGVRLFAAAIPLVLLFRLAGFRFSNLKIYFFAILGVAVITMFYTFFGGIKAVVWMDVVQMTVYIGGALLAAGLIAAGLPGGIKGALNFAEISGKLAFIRTGFELNFSEFLAQPYTLLTALLGGAFFSIASHGTDQLIVQRLLTTRNLKSARRAIIGSGIAVVFQYSLFMFIGLLLFRHYSGGAIADLGLAAADEVFVKFVMEEMPAGLSGLVIAAILAAAMSTLSSSINSLASSAAMDWCKPWWGSTNTPEQDLRISRRISLLWGVIITAAALVFAWLQIRSGSEQPAAVELGLGIASYTYGGLLGIFILGLLPLKLNRKDALFGFFSGLLVLLFLVDGPVQNILPGGAVTLAWPLYTVVGSGVVLLAGYSRFLLFNLIHDRATK